MAYNDVDIGLWVVTAIGTIAALGVATASIWTLIRNKKREIRQVKIEVGNAVCSEATQSFVTYEVRVINNSVHNIRIERIIGKDRNNGDRDITGVFSPNLPMLVSKGDRQIFAINQLDNVKHFIKRKIISFQSFTIIDTLGNLYTGHTPEDTEQFSIL